MSVAVPQSVPVTASAEYADPILLNPKRHQRRYPDERGREVMLRTIEFFENKGLAALKRDDHARVWYQDFLDYQREHRLFATLCTPSAYGSGDTRWDTWRNCEFAEILGFYGLHYWYTWQVSVLGLGPIWMSGNEEVKRRTAEALENGGIFAFGLSEQAHGADLYASEMELKALGDGKYVANGEKYYIGNGNAAAITSIFGKQAENGEFVFFAADPTRDEYKLRKNVVAVQSYVASFGLENYPVDEGDILHRGQDAWDAALNTVNIGKYNLGWASIGICTHAMYEALDHAHNRVLYGNRVTEFSHVKRMLLEAYARTVAMKVVATRASDYFRSATREDRRYLLYNPVVKMVVTTEGEKVVTLLQDVIAARGFENDLYFEMAARDIMGLPRLEGTVHVNMALIVKFMAAWLFMPDENLPEIGRRDDDADDTFLFDQGPTRGLSKVRFHEWRKAFEGVNLPNVQVFKEQVEAFAQAMAAAPPDENQQRDVDYLFAVGEIFSIAAYAQLVLEGAKFDPVGDDLLDVIFGVLIDDLSAAALRLHARGQVSDQQSELALGLVRRPVADAERDSRVYSERVLPLAGAYRMNP
jgi:acyl-CoA dehydrogenase